MHARVVRCLLGLFTSAKNLQRGSHAAPMLFKATCDCILHRCGGRMRAKYGAVQQFHSRRPGGERWDAAQDWKQLSPQEGADQTCSTSNPFPPGRPPCAIELSKTGIFAWPCRQDCRPGFVWRSVADARDRVAVAGLQNARERQRGDTPGAELAGTRRRGRNLALQVRLPADLPWRFPAPCIRGRLSGPSVTGSAHWSTLLRRDLSTGTQVAVKLFKRPVDPEVAHQLVQGINIQCVTRALASSVLAS